MGSAPSPPDPNPSMIASAQASERVAMRQLDLAQQQFDWSKQQAGEDRAFIKPFLDQQSRIADSNEARAEDYYNYDRSTFRPLEQGIVNDAQAFDTEGKREELARGAIADVGQQMGQARAQTARDLSRYGVNPSSTAFANTFANMDTQEGLSKAQAGTNARIQATALGHAMKMDAASLGRNLSSNSSTAYGIALQANQGAQAGRMGLTDSENRMRQGAINDFGDAQDGFRTAGNIYGQDFNARMAGYNAQQQSQNDQGQMWGKLAGTALGFVLADGGHVRGLVRGPGNGVSDSIPARVSDGEYVIPADVVRAKGVEFFDRLKSKYHTPAAVQRRMGVH